MADSSTFIQPVKNQQRNVDICIISPLAKAIEENRHNLLSAECILLVDGNA